MVDARARLQAVRLHRALGRDEERGRAVGDLARDGGGDAAPRARPASASPSSRASSRGAGPRRSLTSPYGAISRVKRPSSIARTARWWLSSANASMSCARDAPLLGDHLGRRGTATRSACRSAPFHPLRARERVLEAERLRRRVIAAPIGIMLMFCTPPATTRSLRPAHHRLRREVDAPAATSRTAGRPSRRAPRPGGRPTSQHVRAMSPACGPMVSTQPKMTSSTARGSILRALDERLEHVRARGRPGAPCESPPFRLPTGVRTASTMNASPSHASCADAPKIARADARAVPRGVAPRGGERPGALHPEVKIVLERVADRAVALQRRRGRRASAASEAQALAIETWIERSASAWASEYAAR